MPFPLIPIAAGLLSNVDRVVEIAEAAALVTTAVGLTRPSVAKKIAKVDHEIDAKVNDVLSTPEVTVGLEMVQALEDGRLTGEDIVRLGGIALQNKKNEASNKGKPTLRELRRANLDR